jgi:glyoxylase-like metal-dependent hydrolase (beta-lactamase superfamily II)
MGSFQFGVPEKTKFSKSIGGSDMTIEEIAGGPLPTNCYLLTDDETKKTAVIDPGFWDQKLADAIRGKNVELILLTHAHFDHIIGVAQAVKETQAKVYLQKEDQQMTTDSSLNLTSEVGFPPIEAFPIERLLGEDETFSLGNLNIREIHTPGHTKGSCCFLTGNAIFSGDTLMKGTVGRTDFPTGSYQDIIQSIGKLKALSGDYKIYPGHEENTTLSWERKYNPYMDSEAGSL